ncbi:GntR family transcriptional regulator [Oceaniovalibus sp. ACAM 378]|uniref:GntR family transcriptional regulator n=1 Tax=Oceaniovalibus sp. ACAM 378 TaxID=2599923 RepID=UPI0011D3CD3C|nr:GntR family transcriptional regulator [Oceaniovalibus sp. ACAM 378]TYB90154.1 GntR family transcriptional regulator [Oceaniovalibus sp. ACAM 378]
MKEKFVVQSEISIQALQGVSAYERLCEDIRSGALKPGARLTETEIAKRLAISRTPVREAIRRLEADGLVTHLPRTGAVVRKLDYSEIMELYEMRTVLEGTAARLAARAASPVELEELQAINEEMGAATGDSAALVRLNRQFHARLFDAARNRFLLKSMASVETTLLILGPSSMESPERVQEALVEHRALLDALFIRDPVAAETAMRQHMEHAQLTRLRMLRRSEPMG